MVSTASAAAITLAVDVMGGDVGPNAILPACHTFLQQHPHAHLLLVAPSHLVNAPGPLAQHPRVQWVAASEVVAMDDPIEVALRRKKDSTMRVAVAQVQQGVAQVAVSAGNTGALMAISRYLLKTLPGIDRPAIATQMPNAKGGATTVLDLGANVDCEAAHLLQFALLGSALVQASTGEAQPTVGLLNIGFYSNLRKLLEVCPSPFRQPGTIIERTLRLPSCCTQLPSRWELVSRAAHEPTSP